MILKQATRSGYRRSAQGWRLQPAIACGVHRTFVKASGVQFAKKKKPNNNNFDIDEAGKSSRLKAAVAGIESQFGVC